MDALEIRRIRVRSGRLDAEVAVALSALHVDVRVAGRICALLPNLPNHLCVNNEKGPRLADELCGTELAHLLEHVVIELQGQAYAGMNPRPQLYGHTSWLEELADTSARGIAVMRVTVTFQDDLVALQALTQAALLVNWACGESLQAPDMQAVIARIRSTM